MRFYKPRHIVLNTIAASGADLIISDQIVWLGSNRIGRYLDFEPKSVSKQTAITSETAGVVIMTPSAVTNSTVYSFSLTQVNPNPTGTQQSTVTEIISVTTPSTGTPTATTVVTQFINEHFTSTSSPFFVTTTGGGTLTLTAKAGYPVLFGAVYNSGGTVAVNNSVAGIETRGLPAEMIALGVPSALVTGTAYTLYALGNNEHTGQNNAMKVNQPETVYIWLSETATNYAALITAMDTMLAGTPAGILALTP